MAHLSFECCEAVPVGIFVVDAGMGITFFNSTAERITGYSRSEALSCKCFEIFRAARCFEECPLRAALEKKNTVPFRTGNTILTKDNREIPIEISASVLSDENGNVTCAIECFQEPLPLADTNTTKKEAPKNRESFEAVIGTDSKMRDIIDILTVASKTDAHILLTGETGTGKDILARSIHRASNRREDRFIKVNCAAMPGELLESEFFGYKKGAFTDAKTDKPGRFQLAEGGTIFLDEIGELPLALQAKLLQVVDEKTFYPLGASKPHIVNVRVISSTNRNLAEMVEEGLFREDLFYRLNVINIELPPIRNRRSDIPILIDHFLSEFRPHDCGKSFAEALSDRAKEILLHYSYPGNIRELKHILEHACIMSQGKPITAAMLPPHLAVGTLSKQSGIDGPAAVEDLTVPDAEERDHILDTLRCHKWNRQKAATALSIDRTTLWRKMKRLKLLE